MRQEPNMKAAEGAGLTMDNLDFEFMTRGDPVVQAKDTAGRFQQNLTPEEINEMAELAPYAEKFMLLTIKGETGKIPSQEDVNQLLQQTTQEMASTNEQGMAIEQGSGTRVPQDMQTKRKVPSRPVEEQVPQNAAVPADNAAPIDRMMSEGGKVGLEAAKDIVKEKYPQQARYLDVLNIVIKPDMEGHSEYRSGDYDDSKEYGYKHTIEINPKYSKTPEQIASTIAGETLHHMKDKDPEFRQMWLGLRKTLGEDPDFRKRQETRQDTMNRMRQEEFIREGSYKNPISNRGPYNDMRDVDHFIDASALDEWIRAYQFKDDPIAGKHYDKSWKTDEFHKDERYQPQFENIRQYLAKGMAIGGVAAGPIGVVDKPGADNSGVADDVPAESDGFVINAAAVRHAGLRDINDMIQGAIEYAKKQGIELDFGKTPVDAEQILVSNGEVLIPHVLANIIGYDKLEKINNRGKEETEEMIANQEQQQTQPVMQVARGGEIFPAEDALIESQMEDFGGISPRIEMLDSDDVYGYSFDTMYDAISEFEWRGQKPQFGFVAVRRTDKVPSSAFGPAQIVGDTTKDIINNPTKYNLNDKDIEFANKLQAAQTLFINLSNGYKKRGTFEGRRAGNTKFGKVALQTLGIDLNKFDSLVKDGYFLPSNQKNSKGLPEEIFGSGFEQNYKNLFKAVVKSKLNRSDVTDLNSFLEKYHGSTTDVKSNTFYRDGVLKILGK